MDNWALYRSAIYLCGKGLDIGASKELIARKESQDLGKYCIGIHPAKAAGAAIMDDKLDVFANGVFDYVFVRRAIESIPEPKKLLEEAVTKLKVGGHLLLHLPINAGSESQYILHQFEPEAMKAVVASIGSWQMKAEIIRDGFMLLIFKKLASRPGKMLLPKPKPEKSVCIVRYGAFGDMVMITPLIKKYKEEGYHVTVNCTTYSAKVLNHNPHVDNVIPQERDIIYNPELGKYWSEWSKEYDKYINLSESIEGKLLVVEGRPEFYMPQRYRNLRANKNYYDFTMELGGFPESKGILGELYFNHTERKRAEKFRREYKDKFIVMWSLNGSSYHKMYPLMEPVLNDWLAKHKDAMVITTGDAMSKLNEFEHPQVICASGEWDIRDVMCMTNYVDLVVGPETGILNAAGCFDTKKLIFLSHSSCENLCKYFKNHFCLKPDQNIAPCYPCHQLHYSRESCPQAGIINDLTGEKIVEGPVCAMGAISGERVIAALDSAYNQRDAQVWSMGDLI